MTSDSCLKLDSSFRDPCGFIFNRNAKLLRQINFVYQNNYDFFLKSGLCEKLQSIGYLVKHKEVDIKLAFDKKAYKIIEPEKIPFISYPYGWSFGQLKDAALLTLEMEILALKYGMTLKDATAYNVQFLDNKPIFIDTLSFEIYKEGQPWVAYKQFCQHFLAPLLLMSYKDIRLGQLLKIYLDGIPLDLASKLLPFKTKLNPKILANIHLHAGYQNRFSGVNKKIGAFKLSKISLLALIDNLKSTINGIKLNTKRTEWSDYYEKNNNYLSKALKKKLKLVESYVDEIKPKSVCDLGGNTGKFSRLASKKGILTISLDIDPLAVEYNYQYNKQHKEKNILPLILDLTNPNAGKGWNNTERQSFFERKHFSMCLCLALIHHLTISNNIPFCKTALFLSKVCDWLVIEFVPKSDSQVKKLLLNREDIFIDYTQKYFEAEFGHFFKVVKSSKINGSKRVLYLMKSKRK